MQGYYVFEGPLDASPYRHNLVDCYIGLVVCVHTAMPHHTSRWVTCGLVNADKPHGERSFLGFARSELRAATDNELRAALAMTEEQQLDLIASRLQKQKEQTS